MCARYTLTAEQAKLVLASMVRVLWFAPRYNIAPTQRVPVVIEDAQGVRQVDMRWGLKAAWGNTLHINAQAEHIQTTATFKALLNQRCLVPMDGFYEWKPDKSPVRFVRRKREVFYVAGLWKADER
jgi:putative SOS response-associated peptidase YedK